MHNGTAEEIKNAITPKTKAIIQSMTPKERTKPAIINASRKKRIAAGSGTTVEDVNKLLRQFEQTTKLMKQLSSGKFGKKGRHGMMGGFPF